MKTCNTVWIVYGIILQFIATPSAFFLKWPFSFFGTTSAGGSGTINYGFLRPAILVPVTTTTEEATTTTTTPAPQFFINALLGNSIPVSVAANSSILFSLANALANRPVFGGVAQSYPSIIGGGGIPGILPITGGIPAAPALPPPVLGGIANPSGGLVLPNGFPATGGVATSGLLPGFFPGIIGRSNKRHNEETVNPQKSSGSGRVVFASKR